MPRGGKRKGAGRPKGTTKGVAPSKIIRVPKDETLLSKISKLIKIFKNEKKDKKIPKKTQRPF